MTNVVFHELCLEFTSRKGLLRNSMVCDYSAGLDLKNICRSCLLGDFHEEEVWSDEEGL